MKSVIITLFLPLSFWGATLDVGSGQTYATIQLAIDAAVAGDTVLIHDGNYTGARLVSPHVSGTSNSPITIQCQSLGGIIDTPNSDGNGITVNKVDYVVINGCTISSMTTYGIDLVESTGSKILNNSVDHSGRSGILTGFAYRVEVGFNTTSFAGGTQHGIYVSNSALPLDLPWVHDNISFSNTGSGIQFNGDCSSLDSFGHSDGMIDGGLIENNILHDNAGPAFSLINISGATFRNNKLYNSLSVAGFKLADEGCGLGSNNNNFVNNTIHSTNGTSGIRIVSGTNNHFWNNIIIYLAGNFKCVIDGAFPGAGGSAQNCTDGLLNNFYKVGLEATTAIAASGVIFTNYSTFDFTLTNTSTALNTGVSSFHSITSPLIDILGNARPRSGAYDSGAYQYNTSAAGADSTPPTTPGTPSTSSITPYLVSITWSASTDNRQVLGYLVFRGATVVGLVSTPGFTDTTASPGSTYSYTIQAYDDSLNFSSASGVLSTTVPGQSGCMNADATSFRNRIIPTHSDTYTIEYDVTPYSNSANDGSVGLSTDIPIAYSGLATIVIFSPSGVIEARNGSVYSADTSIPYSLGSAYHIRSVIITSTHTYSVYVTPPSSSEVLLASNYGFRAEQSTAPNLQYISVFDDAGSIAVCNISINSIALDSMILSTQTVASSNTSVIVAIDGSGQPIMSQPSVIPVNDTSYTLTESVSGNKVLKFTSNSPITVTIPSGMAYPLSFTLLQYGSGVISLGHSPGVTLIQTSGFYRSAGRGSPITVQGTDVQDEYFVWGGLRK